MPIKEPGTLKAAKAVGWYIEEYQRAQISINLVDYHITSPHMAFEESKRIGDRNHASFVAGNLTGGLLYRLRLDEAEEILTDSFWSAEPSDQCHRLVTLADLELRRGNRQQADLHLDAARVLLEDGIDVQARLGFERVEATFALLDDDPATTFEIGVRHFEETPFAPGISVWLAVLGSALLGDLEKMLRALEMAESLPPGVFNCVTGCGSTIC